MMIIIYNLVIYFYAAAARLLGLFNRKARAWVTGRKNWYTGLKEKIIPGEKYIWIHCSSLGEFEQGRPVIEALKKDKPQYKILLTFFSPSGYEIRKDYNHADIVCYLPHDTPDNAGKFISLVDPFLAIFVKYEFWNNYISAVNKKGIPLYLISGLFRKDQHFFKWYGSFFRGILRNFTWIFVQDQSSEELLKSIGLSNVSVAGDTRFDRVVEIAEKANRIPEIELFRGSEKLFIAGSSWNQDEEIISAYINKNPEKIKWVFAPHEIDKGNLDRLQKLLDVSSVRFSELNQGNSDARVLIIDNIGMLSSAYRYAHIAAVGGGFGKGIHNILEPACWGIPVIFGPRHEKFREATELLRTGGGKTFSSFEDFSTIIEEWLTDEQSYDRAAKAALTFVRCNTGATHKIMASLTPKDINRNYS